MSSSSYVYIAVYRRHETGAPPPSRSYHWAIVLSNSTTPGHIGNWYQIDRDTTGRSWATNHGSGDFLRAAKFVGFVRLACAGVSTSTIRDRIARYPATQDGYPSSGWSCADYCIRIVDDLCRDGHMAVNMQGLFNRVEQRAQELEDNALGEVHNGIRIASL